MNTLRKMKIDSEYKSEYLMMPDETQFGTFQGKMWQWWVYPLSLQRLIILPKKEGRISKMLKEWCLNGQRESTGWNYYTLIIRKCIPQFNLQAPSASPAVACWGPEFRELTYNHLTWISPSLLQTPGLSSTRWFDLFDNMAASATFITFLFTFRRRRHRVYLFFF